MRIRAAAACGLFVLSGVGCQFLVGIDSRSVGDASADGNVDAGNLDATSDLDASSEAAPPADAHVGPALVLVGQDLGDGSTFGIGATEVTVAQYKQFISAKSSFAPGDLPSFCASLETVPTPPPPVDDRLPVTDISWCDAWAFCKWAGQRLCGQIGGGPLTIASQTDPFRDQWYLACSHHGDREYGYSNVAIDGRCNVGLEDGGLADGAALEQVGTNPGCTSGYPGVLDMVGNAREWEDSNQFDDAGAVTYWGYRNSGWSSVLASGCSDITGVQADQPRLGDVGFRCCSSP